MRECGILLPVFSLPSPYGIGAFSREAYAFVDRLKEAGQTYWQILPFGPTGYGDSPYQAFSAFAGNPFYVDLETLVEERLLTKAECDEVDFGEGDVPAGALAGAPGAAAAGGPSAGAGAALAGAGAALTAVGAGSAGAGVGTAPGPAGPTAPTARINYEKLYFNRFPLLRKAYARWLKELGHDGAWHAFETQLGQETKDYCLFMAVKDAFDGKPWSMWDEDIKLRRGDALERYRREWSEDVLFYGFLQLKFNEQWCKLKAYANDNGIRIIGDIPIYVAFDSADAWSHPEMFQFDQSLTPKAVAGCPPDGFSATGQLWGNPLYDWGYHKNTGFAWWISRMAYCFSVYDLVRVDHFRGFDEYYAIPYGDKTAQYGHWEKGPGIDIFHTMAAHFGNARGDGGGWAGGDGSNGFCGSERRGGDGALGSLPIIAEDLGFLTDTVLRLLADSGFPGMKVLEFAFDSREASDYLPHNYGPNCVVYTGTHDNDTLRGWYEKMAVGDRDFSKEYMGNARTPADEIHWDFIRMALASVATWCIIPMQDYLGLGSEARINEPSTLGRNWQWRMGRGDFTDALTQKCKRMATIYGRLRTG
ncbi:MAG: 4-alpha-glucanotransferase [Lachnospiraceae bacterium]|jgi:4-alpha-glucanotransferase|nr:4-alpha-glucanotransferase [Lachnospiraceae bacterium]